MLLASQGGVKPFICNSFALTRVFNFQLKQLPHLTPPQLGEEANAGVTTLTPSLEGEGWDGQINKINRNNFTLSTLQLCKMAGWGLSRKGAARAKHKHQLKFPNSSKLDENEHR